MSLIGLALRIVTVKALTGKTFAEGRVFDSAIAPLDTKVGEDAAPLLVVYTDEEDATLTASDMFVSDRDLSLVIHAAVANRVTTTAGGVTVEIPHTDEGLEATLDLMRHDIVVALQSGADDWCDLWRRLVVKRKSLGIRRGASAKKGLRFAARELTLHVDTVADPVPGFGDTALIVDLVAALRSDPDLADLADLIAARVSSGSDWPDWKKVSAALGLNRRAHHAVGLGPQLVGEAPASSIRLELDQGGGRSGFVSPEGDSVVFVP